MTRTMYDGIAEDAPYIAQIPTAIGLVAGYDDGDYAWSAEDWDRFPSSTHVHIAVHSTTNSGSVLDVETGDATPAEAVNWVLMRRAAGADPTVYCNTSTWAAIQAAFATHDVTQPHYWVADYDGVADIPAGAIAKQYQNTAHWDLSAVAAYWPGVDDPEGDDMPLTPADVDLILDTPIARAGHTAAGAEVGLTSLRNLIAWSDAGIQGTRDEIQVFEGHVADLGQPTVDATALATALAGNASFVSAIAAAVVAAIGTDLKPTA